MRNVGYFFLFELVYCVCFVLLFFVSLLILGLLSQVEWLYRILYYFSDAAPEFVLFTVSSIISTLPMYHLAGRLDAYKAAMIFGIVSLAANVALLVYSLIIKSSYVLYTAQVFPLIAVIVQSRKESS